MYHFAVCDNEQDEINKTNILLKQYRETHMGCDFTVETFLSMNELLNKVKFGTFFDLLLLDIYMPGKNGMQGAKELRNNGYEGRIIFLTTSKEYAMDAFEVGAVQYLLKPIEPLRFFDVLDSQLSRVREEQRRYLALRVDGEVRRIKISDIVYAESQNQYQSLHLADGQEQRTRMTLTELNECIGGFSDFVRVGSAYIVNLTYVDSMNAKVMRLTTGKEVWLPRGSYAALKERYFEFYRLRRER